MKWLLCFFSLFILFGCNENTINEADMFKGKLNDKEYKAIELSVTHFNNYLKKCYPNLKALISYSDTSVGNNGTIYKAANYKLIDNIKADFYILENGERVHPVTMWHRHKSRAWELMKELYPNIKKADGRQLKFLYSLS